MSVHGYKPYKPKDYTRQVLAASQEVLISYEAWEHPMSVRQLFYRLIAKYKYSKTEADYKSLIGYIARSRRAYQHRVNQLLFDGEVENGEEAAEVALKDPTLIPFSWIRDDRGQTHTPTAFDDVDDFLDSLDHWIEDLQRDRAAGQSRAIELWCEAGGMVPLMREIARPYGVRVSSGGGYDSVTAKHNLAKRAVRRLASGDRLFTTVLHVGDFDPSGEGMFNTLVEDVGEMLFQTTGLNEPIAFERIALTEEQVIELNAETAPPKSGDSRHPAFLAAHPDAREHFGSNSITVQLEALAPPDLVKVIEEAIEAHVDDDALDVVKATEEELRGEIRERLGLTGFEEE